MHRLSTYNINFVYKNHKLQCSIYTPTSSSTHSLLPANILHRLFAGSLCITTKTNINQFKNFWEEPIACFSLMRHMPHRKRCQQPLLVATETFLPSCSLATRGGICRLMEGIYEVRHRDWLSYDDTQTNIHSNCFRH